MADYSQYEKVSTDPQEEFSLNSSRHRLSNGHNGELELPVKHKKLSCSGKDHNDLDAVFHEVGEFKFRQIAQLFLLNIPSVVMATYVLGFVFTANTLEHRCKVPECDSDIDNRQIQYDQSWLSLAIPSTNGTQDKCFRYAPLNSSNISGQCSAEMFDTTKKIECTEFVYETDNRNIQTEFNVHCSDRYKLALVGTITNIGRFSFFPLTGVLSDKFGRRTILILGTFCASVFGIIKSFSTSYVMFIVIEFLQAAAGTCTHMAIFLLCVENVSSKHRVLVSILTGLGFGFGSMLLGLLAMYIHDFRYLLRTIYVPSLLVITYFWLIPESVRWLLVTGRVDRAIKTLKGTAAANGRQLSDKTIELLKFHYTSNSTKQKQTTTEKPSFSQSFSLIIKSRKLFVRLLCCCLTWVILCYSSFGLSQLSTQIRGENPYISFIIVGSVEIPANLVPVVLLNRFKRRPLAFMVLCLSGVAIILSSMVPKDKSFVVLSLFVVGKGLVSCAFAILYVCNAEIWPTQLRTSIMNIGAMVGRIGAMVAPFTPLLAEKHEMIPYLLFGGLPILAAFLMLLFPETFNKKLPDTIEEAENL